MYHKISGRKLGRFSSHRALLMKNLSKSLIKHGKISTTLPKAKELRSCVEKLVTVAKKGISSVQSLHFRRELIRKFGSDCEEIGLLLSEVAPKYLDRNGGYTRIIKTGFRKGDNADMALIEFV